MGRPKSENPKTFEVKTSIDEETYLILKRYCEKHQLKNSEVIRLSIERTLRIRKKNNTKEE